MAINNVRAISVKSHQRFRINCLFYDRVLFIDEPFSRLLGCRVFSSNENDDLSAPKIVYINERKTCGKNSSGAMPFFLYTNFEQIIHIRIVIIFY